MARAFSSNAQRVVGASTVATINGAADFTIAFCFYPNWAQTDGVDHVFFETFHAASYAFKIQKYSDSKLYCGFIDDNVDYRVIVNSGDYTINQSAWNSFLFLHRPAEGVISGVYLNGTFIGGRGSFSAVGLYNNHDKSWGNSTAAGIAADPGAAANFDGRIAECVFYSSRLGDDEIAGHAKGLSPLLIRPANIDAYWPMTGRDSPEPDRMGDYPLTVTGATYGEHAPTFYPHKRKFYSVPSVSSTFTGTSTLTTEVFTLSTDGTFSPGTKTGTSDLTTEVFTLSSSATFVAPTYTGTSTLATEVFTLASDGTFSPGTKTGTSDLTTEVFTLSTSATFTAPVYTGTSALATEVFTLSADGTFTAPVYTGTSALSLDTFTLSSSGTFTAPVYTGSAALTTEEFTLQSDATFTAPSNDRTGTSSLTTEVFTLSSSGTFTAPVYTGTSDLTTEVFTLSATGIFATAVYQGTSSLSTEVFTLTSSATFTAPTYTGTSTLTTEVFTLSTNAQFVAPTFTGTSSLQTEPFTMVGSGNFLPCCLSI